MSTDSVRREMSHSLGLPVYREHLCLAVSFHITFIFKLCLRNNTAILQPIACRAPPQPTQSIYPSSPFYPIAGVISGAILVALIVWKCNIQQRFNDMMLQVKFLCLYAKSIRNARTLNDPFCSPLNIHKYQTITSLQWNGLQPESTTTKRQHNRRAEHAR